MGLMALNRLMSLQLEQKRNRTHTQGHNGSIASLSKGNSSTHGHYANSHGGKKKRCPGPDLPEDIWCYIHFLLPMRDAARVACVSHSFLRSWRCYPNLTFTKETMCSKGKLHKRAVGDYNNNIGDILANHNGAGVKIFRLDFHGHSNTESDARLISWLQIALTLGIEELDLTLSSRKSKFNFPCTHLSERGRDSLRYLRLLNCALRPKIQLCLRSLKILHLHNVRITGDELGCLLSSSSDLEELNLVCCNDIIRLEIPSLLQRLSFLDVLECSSLQVIENKAPNISIFRFGGNQVQLSLGESLKVKEMKLGHSCAISYAIENLPSCVPNVETLTIHSRSEIVSALVVSSQFLHLKLLTLYILGWNFHRDYDYLSLVSFLDASPSLATFNIIVTRQSEYEKFDEDPSSLRRMPMHCHANLKGVLIDGFCPQKSMIELTCYILENSTSLEWLTLDTCSNNYQCFGNLDRKCYPLESAIIREAHKTVLAVRAYVEGKVPSTVKLNVLEPCSRCHAL